MLRGWAQGQQRAWRCLNPWVLGQIQEGGGGTQGGTHGGPKGTLWCLRGGSVGGAGGWATGSVCLVRPEPESLLDPFWGTPPPGLCTCQPGSLHCVSVCPSSRHLWGRGDPCRCPTGEPCGTCLPPAAGPHLLQQRQLGEELVGAVLRQEVGPLLAGLGVGAAEVLEEAGLGQGGRDGVLALLVVWQGQPVAPGQPPGEALQRGGGGGGGRTQAQDPSAGLS